MFQTSLFYYLSTKLVKYSFFSEKSSTFAAAKLNILIPNEKKDCYDGCNSHACHRHLGRWIDD